MTAIHSNNNHKRRARFMTRRILLYWGIALGVLSLYRTNKVEMTTGSMDEIEPELEMNESVIARRASSSSLDKKMKSSPQKMLPNLLLAGVQKAGTTAVDNYMREQNMVCSAHDERDMNGYKYTTSKEVHFFDVKERFNKGLDFYMELYNHCNFTHDHKFLIDSTPNYQLHPERIYWSYKQHDKNALKQLKIIFTVREPVAREMSWFNHWSNSHRWRTANQFSKGYKPTFENDYLPEMIQTRDKKALKGLYYKWFQKWFHYFDRNQILILSYDEIKRHPERAMQRVHKFLNVPLPKKSSKASTTKDNNKGNNIAASGVISNKLSTDGASCERQEELRSWFQNDTQQFYQLLEDHPGPPMEQRPFPKFQFECYKNPGSFANTGVK